MQSQKRTEESMRRAGVRFPTRVVASVVGLLTLAWMATLSLLLMLPRF